MTLAEENGEQGLLYKIPKVDVALLKASYADEKGNISFENECASIDALSVAQATHRNGGKVIVQVVRVVNNHMSPRSVDIPAALVDAVVRCPHQPQLTNVEGFYDFICGKYVPSGNILKACREEVRGVIGSTSKRGELHKAIAKRALREIKKGMIINIGIGIPELIAEEVLEQNMLDDVHLSVESGHTGGFPLGGQGFGVAIGPDSMLYRRSGGGQTGQRKRPLHQGKALRHRRVCQHYPDDKEGGILLHLYQQGTGGYL